MFSDSSTLTRVRKRLGPKFFRELEKKTYAVLIERRIIKAKGMPADATVFPEEIKFPTDVGLLNDVRRWLVRTIRTLGGKLRTRRRKAEQDYLRFAKTKRKTKKIVIKAKKTMLQYVRRNLGPLEKILRKLPDVEKKILERLGVSKEIFRQQWEMYKRKVNRISDRIVSLYRPYVRPSFKPLGRAAKKPGKDPWFRKKQKERNRIEGGFGNGKEHYGLSRVQYKGEESLEVWVRASLLAMNLKAALKRA